MVLSNENILNLLIIIILLFLIKKISTPIEKFTVGSIDNINVSSDILNKINVISGYVDQLYTSGKASVTGIDITETANTKDIISINTLASQTTDPKDNGFVKINTDKNGIGKLNANIDIGGSGNNNYIRFINTENYKTLSNDDYNKNINDTNTFDLKITNNNIITKSAIGGLNILTDKVDTTLNRTDNTNTANIDKHILTANKGQINIFKNTQLVANDKGKFTFSKLNESGETVLSVNNHNVDNGTFEMVKVGRINVNNGYFAGIVIGNFVLYNDISNNQNILKILNKVNNKSIDLLQ